MKASILAVALTALIGNAQAVQVAAPCGGDKRIRCANYDPKEVVAITAMFGYQTFIYFSPDEKITDMGGGDTEAWSIGVIDGSNGIFIKPKSSEPATNITVITNHKGKQRFYNFDFNVEAFTEAEKRTYMVWFKYPEDEALKASVVSEKSGPSIANTLKFATAKKPKNEDYWFDGSTALAPTAAWDDGEFTYLRFAPNAVFPAVYVVNEDGTESLLNKHVPERQTIAVQLVARKLVLRRGNLVTCIFNESYDPYGVESESDTVSPDVVRKLKDSDTSAPQEPRRQAIPYTPSRSGDGGGTPPAIYLPPAQAVPTVQGPQPFGMPGTPATNGSMSVIDLSKLVPEQAITKGR